MSIRMRSKRVCFALVLAFAVPSIARAQSDGMAEYRERFKTGLARYQEGATADALQWWEPIYRELGPERGWRLAFNLARAYEALGDATHAVERYQAFLAQVTARRARGEPIEPLIEREEKEARDRSDDLATTKGRIVLAAGVAPIAVKIDGSEPRLAGFTAYVAPGAHVVVFEPGTSRELRRSVVIAAGEAIEVAPPESAPAPGPVERSLPMVTPVSPRMVRTIERPFPEPVLWTAGGVTLASVVVPVLTYVSASEFQGTNRLSGDADALSQADNSRVRADYDSRKTTYYATLAIPATLAVATGALTTWYFVGSRTREVPVTIGVSPAPGGASIRGSF